MCQLDHLVVTAPSLGQGVDWVADQLGVRPQRGGSHVNMGTHNALLRLGDSLYLEVLAIDPNAPAPNRARWINLDNLQQDEKPRLTTWMVRTNDIERAAAASPIPLGPIQGYSRGDFQWLITVPEDGSLPADGIAPTLIEWRSPVHPAANLTKQGCSLIRLEGYHREYKRINKMLEAIGFDGPFTVSDLPDGNEPYLRAIFRTPIGERTL